MSDSLKRFLADVNLPGKVRARYKNDFDAVATEYGLSDDEKNLVKDKNNPTSLAELQKRVGTGYSLASDPKDFVSVSTN